MVRKSARISSVRDRGVGGSNPLAPTAFFGARRSALRADFTPSPRLSSLHSLPLRRVAPFRSLAPGARRGPLLAALPPFPPPLAPPPPPPFPRARPSLSVLPSVA